MSAKIAVVTGSNKGLGFEIVKRLCENFNGFVFLTSRDENRGLEACKQLNKLGLFPLYHQLDITNSDSIQSFYNHIKERNGAIDLLVNNAGVLFLKDSTEPLIYQAEQTLSVNFYGLVDFTEKMLPILKNGGKVVNISSSSGHLSRIPSQSIREKLKSEETSLEDLKNLMNSYVEAVRTVSTDIIAGWGNSPYVVSKVGVNAYTFMLHRKLQDKEISVCCVHPGYLKTDMTRGSGSVNAARGARLVVDLALHGAVSGQFVWHDRTVVPWDGPDPRGFIDGQTL